MSKSITIPALSISFPHKEREKYLRWFSAVRRQCNEDWCDLDNPESGKGVSQFIQHIAKHGSVVDVKDLNKWYSRVAMRSTPRYLVVPLEDEQ